MRDRGISAYRRFACDSHFRQPIAERLSPASPISNGLSGKRSQLRRDFQLGKDHGVLDFSWVRIMESEFFSWVEEWRSRSMYIDANLFTVPSSSHQVD